MGTLYEYPSATSAEEFLGSIDKWAEIAVDKVDFSPEHLRSNFLNLEIMIFLNPDF